MIAVVLVDLPEAADPNDVAQAVLARLEDEAGYDEGGNPYVPATVTVWTVKGAENEEFARACLGPVAMGATGVAHRAR